MWKSAPMAHINAVRVIAKKMNGSGDYEDVLAEGVDFIASVLDEHEFIVTQITAFVSRMSHCTQTVWVHYAPVAQYHEQRRYQGVKDLSAEAHFPY